jgi:archaemetzincin
MRPLLLSLFALLIFALPIFAEPAIPRIAIQPLGKVAPDVIQVIERDLKALYRVEVEVLPQRELPASAFYKPRARYRAEKLLAWLEKETPAGFTKVIGITVSDISTTKEDVFDWGIFGLGEIDSRPCVVSTFRLGRGVLRAKMLRRTGDVAGHEAGHTFGLQHCISPHCMMNDAGGKIQSVDESTHHLCPECRRLLGGVARE